MSNSSYLFLNDSRVHYLHWGTQSGSQPLVMLHGLASNARIWEMVAPHLAQAGFQAYAPDLRGHGLTDKPDGDYSFETLTRDLGSFLNVLELERPILVGHSWGALIALSYAARVTLGPRGPAGIVLVDGGMTQMDESGLSWEEMRQRLTPPHLAGTSLESFLERLNTPNARWQPDDQAIQIILANFEVADDETIYPRLSFDKHMQIVRAMWEFKTYDQYRQVRCPVLLLPARPAAPLLPIEAEYVAYKESGVEQARLRNQKVQVEWMVDTVHDIPLQRPAELAARLVKFTGSLKSL